MPDASNHAGETPIVLCVKVGRLPMAPPPGYLTSECSRCGSAVWAAPATLKLVKALAARPVCSDCAGHTGGTTK